MEQTFVTDQQSDDFDLFARDWQEDALQHQIESDNLLTQTKAKIDDARRLLTEMTDCIMPESDRLEIQAILKQAGSLLARGNIAHDMRNIVELDSALGGESDLAECHDHLIGWYERHDNL